MTPGDRVGPYEILAPIGAGGMGEVWKARDTRLDRIVAVKVSKVQFSERFEREARAVAALNHPHVCQLYDVGPDYLVMEFVEGAPLKGPLPLEKAVEYAGQILDALDAAHRKGITHRDLKPGNILVTKQGIKLLDFGLAKQSGPLKETDGTLTSALTGQGQILGTLQYMSPEQLNGKEADARSDLFSFGCVLYEMLTGRRAFEGHSAASVIAAILEREPAPLDVARPLDRVVRRALAKDPDQRFQTARDSKAALAWALEQPVAPGTAQPRNKLPWAVAAALAVIAAVSLWAWWRSSRPMEQPLQPMSRLEVYLGADVWTGNQYGADVVISPDATRLAYFSGGRLFTRRLDQLKASELPGTEGANCPFFSSDGQWLAFFTTSKLKKISVEGGNPIELCNSGAIVGGSWGEDGTIIAALSSDSPLLRISSAGGTPSVVMGLAPGEFTQRWPQFLPDARAVIFTSHTASGGFDAANIDVFSFADHRRKTLVRGGTYGRYLSASNGTSYLLYMNRGALYAAPFDLDRLELRGTPLLVLQDVSYSPTYGLAQYAVARNGTLVYRGGGSRMLVTLQWLDSSGMMQPLLAKPGAYRLPKLSPDGRRVAMQVYDRDAMDLWTYGGERNAWTRLTFGAEGSRYSTWTPDGRYLVVQGSPGGMNWIRADGAGRAQPLTQSKNLQIPWSFSRDGKRLAFSELTTENAYDLWVVPVEQGGEGLRAGKPEVFLGTPFDERHPSFSPDGRWLAYDSTQSGRFEIYVRAYPTDKGGQWLISNNGGVYPEWSGNGRELFYRTEENRIMVASYKVKGDTFVPDTPRLWSEKQPANVGVFRNYDLAPDGKRVLALMSAEGPEAQTPRQHVIFLLNFADEVRRRLGSGAK